MRRTMRFEGWGWMCERLDDRASERGELGLEGRVWGGWLGY